MKRAMLFVLLLATAAAGCMAPSGSSEPAGWIGVGEVQAAPGNATVIDGNRIEHPSNVRELFESASNRVNTSDPQVVRELSEAEFEQTRSEFADYPRYEGDDARFTGYYVNYENRTYRVVIEPDEDGSR